MCLPIWWNCQQSFIGDKTFVNIDDEIRLEEISIWSYFPIIKWVVELRARILFCIRMKNLHQGIWSCAFEIPLRVNKLKGYEHIRSAELRVWSFAIDSMSQQSANRNAQGNELNDLEFRRKSWVSMFCQRFIVYTFFPSIFRPKKNTQNTKICLENCNLYLGPFAASSIWVPIK